MFKFKNLYTYVTFHKKKCKTKNLHLLKIYFNFESYTLFSKIQLKGRNHKKIISVPINYPRNVMLTSYCTIITYRATFEKKIEIFHYLSAFRLTGLKQFCIPFFLVLIF